MGGGGVVFELEFQRHGGIEDMEFPQGTDKSVFLEKAYFMDLIVSQIKHELTKLLTMAGAGYKID